MSSQFDAYLTNEDKQEIVQKRIQQFASEGYQYELNKKLATEQGDAQRIELAENEINVRQLAIQQHLAELEDLRREASSDAAV